MTHSSTRSVLGGIVVSAALLLAACGTSGANDSADKQDTTTTAGTDDATTTTEAETSTTEAGGDDDAQARAESIDLTVSDFPDGWEATPSTTDDSPSPLEECDDSFADESTTLATYSTDDFTLGSLDEADGTNMAAETKVFTDEAAARAALGPFSDADVISCIDAKLKELFGAGAEVAGELTEDDATLDADQAEGVSATYTISAPDGSTAEVNVGLLLIRTGDLATMVSITAVGPNFDITPLQGVVARITELQAAA